jgi:hypothetical protein
MAGSRTDGGGAHFPSSNLRQGVLCRAEFRVSRILGNVQVPMDLGKKACATLLHLSMILPNGISGRLVSEFMVGKDKYSKKGDSEGASVA